MQATCGNCNRSYELDEQLADGMARARCECGAEVTLPPKRRGTQLGKYVLHHRIAVGGMGEIFYGKIAGVEGFEREVAIKKMLPHLTADRNFIEMMVKEAKLTVLLNHPNIVQVYDLAKEGREYYIAMEFVPGVNGGNLLEYCRQIGILLPVEVAVHIVLNVLKGLQYAHGLRGPDGTPMGVLHRDITPQNILVTRAGWVKITDFGIAKARNEISTTSPGMIKGKLGYIAPEQLTGEAPDHRVDLFCAGIMLWETLACRRLFKGETEIDTFRLISEAKIPPLEEARNDVSADLEAVIRRSLARDRDDRFSSGSEFYDALAQTMSPQTPDDLNNATIAFFAKHAALFNEADVNTEDDGLTVEISGADPSPLLPISSLTIKDEPPPTKPIPEPPGATATRPPAAPVKPSRAWVVPMVGLVLLATAGAVGAVMFKDTLFKKGVVESPNLGLTLAEVQLGIDAAGEDVMQCYERHKVTADAANLVTATLTIASTGGVAEALVSGASGKGKDCLETTLKALTFRRNNQPSFVAKVKLAAPPALTTRRPPPVTKNPKTTTVTRPATKPLTSAEIQSVITKHQSGIARCLQTLDHSSAPPEVRPSIKIGTSGKVDSVSIRPSLNDNKAQACLTKVFKGMRFRKHPDQNMAPVTIPLKIKKRGG